ncbi:MAG: hypothetical protein RLZZ536_1175, partial [Planctomycetota bacterium]
MLGHHRGAELRGQPAGPPRRAIQLSGVSGFGPDEASVGGPGAWSGTAIVGEWLC